jgi:tRNA dimethylallyltransferase
MEDHFQLTTMKRLLVIGGPTAGGKTALSIALARHLNTVILSADSRQFYKEMNIGTAKPSMEEQDGIPHFFIDSHSIHEALTAANYADQALEVLNNQFQQHDTIILTGGSGMFIDALCKGLDNIPHSTEIRDQLTAQWKTNGLAFIQEKLKNADPDYYDQVDRQNPVRIIRALEAIEITGKPFSSLRKSSGTTRPFAIQYIIIEHNREALYKRIDRRVDLMMENGLLDEAKALLPHRNLNALNTVGYMELFDYYDGTLSLGEAIEKIKQNTRNYAKRQITWCRRYIDALRIEHKVEIDEMMNQLIEHIALQENE